MNRKGVDAGYYLVEVHISNSSQSSSRKHRTIDKAIHWKETFHWMWRSSTLILANDIHIVLPLSAPHLHQICPGHGLACLSVHLTETKVDDIIVSKWLNESEVSSWGGISPTMFLNELSGTISIWNRIFSTPDPYPVGKDWRWEEKGTTEDEMVGWHHRLNGHEFE